MLSHEVEQPRGRSNHGGDGSTLPGRLELELLGGLLRSGTCAALSAASGDLPVPTSEKSTFNRRLQNKKSF